MFHHAGALPQIVFLFWHGDQWTRMCHTVGGLPRLTDALFGQVINRIIVSFTGLYQVLGDLSFLVAVDAPPTLIRTAARRYDTKLSHPAFSLLHLSFLVVEVIPLAIPLADAYSYTPPNLLSGYEHRTGDLLRSPCHGGRKHAPTWLHRSHFWIARRVLFFGGPQNVSSIPPGGLFGSRMARVILHLSHWHSGYLCQRDVLARISRHGSGLQSRHIEGYYHSTGALVPSVPSGPAQVCDGCRPSAPYFPQAGRWEDWDVTVRRSPWKLSKAHRLGTTYERWRQDIRSRSNKCEYTMSEVFHFFFLLLS